MGEVVHDQMELCRRGGVEAPTTYLEDYHGFRSWPLALAPGHSAAHHHPARDLLALTRVLALTRSNADAQASSEQSKAIVTKLRPQGRSFSRF